MIKRIKLIILSILFVQNAVHSKINRDILLEEIKLLREDPESFLNKINDQWNDYFELGSINLKIHVDHMKREFEFMKKYLRQKIDAKCEFNCFLQFDNNLINLANAAAGISAEKKGILESSTINKLILAFGEKYKESPQEKQMEYHKMYGISFQFSDALEHLTDVLVLILIQSNNLQKVHLEAIANTEYNYLGVHFEKKESIVYGMLFLADKRIV